MLCVIDHKSPCKQACPDHYRGGGCFWEDARRAGKPYYWTCPNCGAHLDPGETCDCMKKAAPSATNTQNGNKQKTHLYCKEIGGKSQCSKEKF